MRNTYKPGQWNALCDRCGFKFKSSELKKDWQGLMVCDKDFELRNPQDFIRVRPERVSVPWARSEGPDQFINGEWLETEDSSIFTGELSYILLENSETLTTEN